MAPRNHVTFKADLPDDSEEDDRGNVAVPAGRNVAMVVVRCLEGEGLGCTAPEQHSHYGWSFEIRTGASRVWCLLQHPEPWLLMVKTRDPVSEPERSALLAIHRALISDARVTEVMWFTEKGYDAPGEAARVKEGHASPF